VCACVSRALLNDEPSAGAITESPKVNRSGFEAAFYKLINKLYGDEVPLYLSAQASDNPVTPPRKMHPTANKRYTTIYKV
jgi:hypothetical protein